MKPGDLVKRTGATIEAKAINRGYGGDIGLFMGLRTFKGNGGAPDYTCAEVMWLNRCTSNGDPVSTIQIDLLEVISESR